MIGDCHLGDDPSAWPPAGHDDVLFRDDDLALRIDRCRCELTYLHVYRRVPRGSWNFLIPVSTIDLRRLDAVITAQAANQWLRVEQAVTELTGTRPYIERTTDPPPVCRWASSGVPLAFTISPW